MIPTAELVGLADPSGKAIGFLVPVFHARESNALLVQQRSDNALVEGFGAIEGVANMLPPSPGSTVRLGDEPIWAFSFAPDDTLQAPERLFREKLKERLDQGHLDKRPLLSVEVAEFLRLPKHRLEAAKKAFSAFRQIRAETAHAWRDLSILTPDLKRAMLVLGAELANSAKRLVARIEGDALVMRLPATLPPAQQKAVEESARAVLRDLSALLPEAPSRWRVEFPSPPLSRRHEKCDAALLVTEDIEGEITSHIAHNSLWKLDVFGERDVSKFRETVWHPGVTGFLLARMPDKGITKDILSFGGRDVIPIILGSGSPFKVDPVLDQFWDDEPGHVVVPAISYPGTRPSPAITARTVVSAIGAAMTVLEMEGPKTIRGRWGFLRSTGSGDDPVTDAIASLYDRALTSGLSTRDVYIAITGTNSSRLPGSRYELEWARDALFPSSRLLHDERLEPAVRRPKIAAQMLLPLRAPRENDEEDLSRAVETVLSGRGWNGGLSIERDANQFYVEGPGALRYVRTRYERPSRNEWGLRDLLERNLAHLETVTVTGAANASGILRALGERDELAISVRDLCSADPRGGIWSLLGAQVRRLATGQLHRSRTHFMALLINHAFRTDSVDFSGDGNVYDAIRDEYIGREVHFSWTRVRQIDARTTALVKMTAGYKNHYINEGEHLSDAFELVLHPAGVALEPAS